MMQPEAKIDLHCHSYYSDGTTSPAALLMQAAENGVTHLAITDHDCTDGLEELSRHKEQGQRTPTLIEGVEISCDWQGLEIHVVGLFVDRHDLTLKDLLQTQQQARKHRVQTMAAKLESLGTPGLMDYLEGLPATAYTRSHVANFLVQEQVVKSRQKSFKSHLGKRGKIYVAANWCTLEVAIATVNAAGGFAVLAHPGRYPLNKKKLEALAQAFKACGGVGIEGSYPNIDPNMMKRLELLARQEDLLLSGGSDFHDPAARWTELGKFPRFGISAQTIGVWTHPIWQARIADEQGRC